MVTVVANAALSQRRLSEHDRRRISVRAGLADWRSWSKSEVGSFTLPHCREHYRDNLLGRVTC